MLTVSQSFDYSFPLEPQPRVLWRVHVILLCIRRAALTLVVTRSTVRHGLPHLCEYKPLLAFLVATVALTGTVAILTALGTQKLTAKP